MANTIKHKRSSSTGETPDASDLSVGEIAVNTADGLLFTKHTDNAIVTLGSTSYAHPNHSGEVTSTGDGATVISDNVVDEANLKVSNSPTNGYFLSAQSGNSGGLTWATVPAGYDDADVTSYLASASSIGIGTSSPDSYDAEADNLVVASSGHTGITIASTGSNQRTNLYFSDGTSGSATYRGGFSYDHNDDSLLVRTAGAPAMTINSSSHVLIGKTADDNTTTGTVIHDNGFMSIARTNNIAMILDRSNEGEILRLTEAGTERGSLHINSDRMLIDSAGDAAGLRFDASGYTPFKNGSAADGTVSLGFAGGRFQNLYLSDNIVVGGTVDGRDLSVDGTKLDGIETGATADQTASQILTAVKTVDGSGSGLDADLLDGVQGNKYFTSYNNAGTTGWEDSNRNFRINGGGSSVGFAMHESDGTFGFNLYADGTNYGFLDANWGNWDLKKVTNGALYVDEGSGLQRVFNDGYHPNADILTTARTINGVSFNGSANITVADSTKLPLAGGAMTGAITTNSTFDGRDVAADGTKLDTIATNANNYTLPAGPAYIDVATGTYGTVKVDDDRGVSGAWAGYAIRDDWVFMSDGASNAGIFNDTDNEWAILCRRNAEVEFYHNGSMKFETTSGGAQVNGSLAVTGTVDGRDVAADGTKLDTIATSANNYSFPYTISQSAGNNTVVRRDSSGYIFSNYFNGTGTFATTGNTSGMARFTGTNGADTYGRSYTAAAARTLLNVADGANNYSLPASPSVTNLNVATSIIHTGDTNTAINFDTDQISITVGGSTELYVNTTGVRLGDSGNGYFQPVSGNYGSIQIDGGDHGGWEGYSIGGRVVFMHDNNVTSGLYNDVNNEWLVRCKNNAETELFYNGVVKAGTSATGLEVAGQITVTSDRLLKDDLQVLDGSLEKIKSLTGYTYRMKDTGVRHGGLIAQDAEAVLPEAVSGDEGNKKLDYNAVIALLVNSTKEQDEKIKSLEARLERLE